MNTIDRILQEVHARFKDCQEGAVADYIPEIFKASPEWYGIPSSPRTGTATRVRGLKTFDELSRRFNLHLFNLPPLTDNSIRNTYKLSSVESNKQRPPQDRDIILDHGDEVTLLIEMQGNLFFSSMERALRAAQFQHANAETIILDVTGVGFADLASQELLADCAGLREAVAGES